jgi:ribosomal protein S18 acetylase RimI-like enzyme
VKAAATAAFGERLHIIGEVDDAVERGRQAHDWYLVTMGTLPAVRRHGLGSAVLQPRLAGLDEAHERAVLETSDLGTVRFYERFGFRVVAELDRLPHGAPTTWVMLRDPVDRGWHPTAPMAAPEVRRAVDGAGRDVWCSS